jgi:hypothetical protein
MMASPSDEAVQAFLRDSMVALVATTSAKGNPFVTPLWFVVDDGVLYMTTGTGSRLAKNAAAGSSVTLLVTGEHGADGARALRLRGTATVHTGLPSWRVLLRIATKYYVAPGALVTELTNAAKWRLRIRYYAQGGVGYLRVVPAEAGFVRRP